jgi:hypothetical protein
MSFTGNGLPAAMERTAFDKRQTDGDGFGPTWYSHTVEDTLDKVDMELFEPLFKVHMATIARLCNHPVLPFDFVPVMEIYQKGLQELQETNRSEIDLTTIISQVETLSRKVNALNRLIEEALTGYGKNGSIADREAVFKKINACLMGLGRLLMPILTSNSGKYHHDPVGTQFKPFPILQPIVELNAMDSRLYEYKALRTSLLRARNQVSDVLKSGNEMLTATLTAS